MAQKEIPYKIYLEESEMPRDWYNVRADSKSDFLTAYKHTFARRMRQAKENFILIRLSWSKQPRYKQDVKGEAFR